MMPAAKHGDPQIGVDIHLCVVPPSPSPVPLPTPHTSIVFDPFDYLPILGATVTVCGMKRAIAGTNGKAIHIPPGFPFAPKIPDTSDEIFMGSATVVADGDPFSFLAVPVLSCQVAGMMSPPRLKKKEKKLMLLPTVTNLAIPTNVFIGGPPTISLTGMAFKLGFAALGRFAKSKFVTGLRNRFKKWRQDKWGHLPEGFLKCKILRAEPVDIVTGEVIVRQQDFALGGRLPVSWVRAYSSNNTRKGACGHGWDTPADIRLEVEKDGSVAFLRPAAAPALFPNLPDGLGDDAAILELWDGALLSDHGSEFRVRTKDDRIYHFAKTLGFTNGHGVQEYPINRISDLCGNWLEFERHDGCLNAINESAGRRIEIDLEDGLIRRLGLFVPAAGFRHTFVQYRYEEAGNLVAVLDGLGNPYTFDYECHHLVRHTDRNGLSFYYEFNKSEKEWRVIHAWGDEGRYDYRFEYEEHLNERRITDSLGNVSLVKLDESGLPISETDPLGGRTLFEYDEFGRATAVVDQDAHRTEFEYDDRGNMLVLKIPDGASVLTEFDDGNRPVRITDPNGAIWEQDWSAHGLLVRQKSPLGSVSHFEYDTLGQLTAFVNSKGCRSQLTFDEYGNLTGTSDPLGQCTLYVRDPLGNVVTREDALGRKTHYTYDVKSRLTAVQFDSGITARYQYDAADNLVACIDETGVATRFEYWAQGQISKRVRSNGSELAYEFDTEGRLVRVRNERGEEYTLKRDPLGRIIEETDYWGQSRRYRYTGAGRIQEIVDPLGQISAYDTDALGRVRKRTVTENGSQPASVSAAAFEYDGVGNLTACENEHIRIERTFDLEGRMVMEKQGPNFVLQNTFDDVGNRVERKVALREADELIEHTVRFGYDRCSQVVEVVIDQEAPIAIARRATGEIVAEQLSQSVRRELEYDVSGRIARQHVFAASRTIADVTYEHDAAGNTTMRRDSEFGVERFRYDPVGKILEHLDPQGMLTSYVSDAAGDMLLTRAVTSGIPDADRGAYADNGGWAREGEFRGALYRFDRAGNVVYRKNQSGELLLRWDAHQRLVESTVADRVTHYRYDPLGRRIEKRTGSARTRFCWDGDAHLCDVTVMPSSKSTPLTSANWYVYYPQSFVPLAVVKAATVAREVFHYHTDPNGAPTRLTDGSGRVVWAGRYSPLGHFTVANGSRFDNAIRLQGQYEDQETGLHYNRHRYFEPHTGQFVTQDPIGLVGGSNIYGYGDNITRWIDPAGLTGVITNKFPDEDLPSDGKIVPHTIEDGKIKVSPPGQREFDFVVTKDNKLVIGKRHHLLGDRSDVLAAGQLRISGDGTVKGINNLSGHYRPTVDEAQGFGDAMRRAGVNMDKATLQPWEILVDGQGNVIHRIRAKPCKA